MSNILNLNKLINLIYPPVCGFCNKINNTCLCQKCESRLMQVKNSTIINYQTSHVFFDEHFYLFKYINEIRDSIIKYKFDEMSYFYKSFSELFIRDSIFKQFIDNYDMIISVPIHKKRMRERGYNQSELIAKEIARRCGKAYYKDVLIKKNNIVAQSSLENKFDRVKNIKDAFANGKSIELVRNKRIAIFDDVFTTGATVNECAKVLKENGASGVGVFTIARS